MSACTNREQTGRRNGRSSGYWETVLGSSSWDGNPVTGSQQTLPSSRASPPASGVSHDYHEMHLALRSPSLSYPCRASFPPPPPPPDLPTLTSPPAPHPPLLPRAGSSSSSCAGFAGGARWGPESPSLESRPPRRGDDDYNKRGSGTTTGACVAVSASGAGSSSATKSEHVCDKCGWTFSKRGNLAKHVKTVHGHPQRKFVCHSCGLAFVERHNRDSHMRLVCGRAKPFGCNTCGARFGRKASLMQHIKTVHEKQRPWTCNVCQKSFGQKATLTKHAVAICNRRA